MLDPGQHVGPFVIERHVGVGSTGHVYRAWSAEHNVAVALKILADELADDPGVVTLLEEEARAGLQINHPNVVRPLQVGRFGKLPYIAFEYVPGIALGQLMHQRKALEEAETIWIMRQMGLALRALGQKRIVHQDIKPDNIMIEGNGNCKLTDLGFARLPAGLINWEHARAGAALYMAPEQSLARSGVQVDCRADLYSLGASMYHAATGTPPFEAEEEEDIFQKHREEKAVPPGQRNPALSREFSRIVMTLLEKDPRNRYQSAEELLMGMRYLTIRATPPLVTSSRVH